MSPGPTSAEPVTGLILAGGRSTRFGSDKASALLRGRPMLQWVADALALACERLVVVRAASQALPALEVPVPVTVAEDLYEGMGPLAGLASGFPFVETPLCFATSCDAPLLAPALVRVVAAAAAGHDIACPVFEGRPQPLAAAYRPSTCLAAFRACIERGDRKIVVAYESLDVAWLGAESLRPADPALRSFANANDPAALAAIERLLAAG